MHQWEYMVWNFEEGHGDRRVTHINGVRQEEGPRLADALTEAGVAGWELAHTYSTGAGWVSFVFVRPKAA